MAGAIRWPERADPHPEDPATGPGSTVGAAGSTSSFLLFVIARGRVRATVGALRLPSVTVVSRP